ncbi:MAG: sulfate adenylyltransferase subunit CysD [Myxococcota bacterium]
MNDAARTSTRWTALDALEAQAIYILRELAAETERAVVLFSGGKDSVCILRLCEKAFAPAPIPFPLLHVDTGHNFEEVIAFRDRRAAELSVKLHVAEVDDAMRRGLVRPHETTESRNRAQIPVLLDALESLGAQAAIGGARRDEEKARAKERVFSFRDGFGQWEPRRQRPELWDLYNVEVQAGDQLRVFPLSNWTELDVWRYIARERLALPSIYFAHDRSVVRRGDQWLAVHPPVIVPGPGEETRRLRVRMRTVGDVTCTGCLPSQAEDVASVIAEVAVARTSERSGRADDRTHETSMEDRKREGYF